MATFLGVIRCSMQSSFSRECSVNVVLFFYFFFFFFFSFYFGLAKQKRTELTVCLCGFELYYRHAQASAVLAEEFETRDAG